MLCSPMCIPELDTAVGVGKLLHLLCNPLCTCFDLIIMVQGPSRRLADAVEQAVQEQVMYVQRAAESERAGEWNADVSAAAL